MKIVHVVYSLELGGAEVLVTQLCRVQRAQGHDVSVCAYAKLGVLGEHLRQDGFRIYVPGEAHPAKTIWRYFWWFRRTRPDVVHMHNAAPTLQAALSAWLAGVRCIGSTRHSLVAPPYQYWAELKYNAMAVFCDWIAGVCEATCLNLRGTPGAHTRKIVRVYNGVEANGTNGNSVEGNAAQPIERDAPTNLQPAGFTLLFVGRLEAVKSLETLLRAVALLGDRVANLVFWIVGDGPERGPLEMLAKELGVAGRVRFWGRRLDTARFFSAADAFAMSSISEGLPMSLLQAMSAGLPAVTTDVGGMAEVLRLSGGGLLAPVGDAAGLAEAIFRLATEPALRQQLAAQGHAAYEREFTLQRMATEYMRLYLD